jgi:hypothetical protein
MFWLMLPSMLPAITIVCLYEVNFTGNFLGMLLISILLSHAAGPSCGREHRLHHLAHATQCQLVYLLTSIEYEACIETKQSMQSYESPSRYLRQILHPSINLLVLKADAVRSYGGMRAELNLCKDNPPNYTCTSVEKSSSTNYLHELLRSHRKQFTIYFFWCLLVCLLS